ncbi:MAG: DNA gyrase subunit A [Acholeplasmatales bacterium]|nr:MAG: DNA gyrase subunit A [Acholeplasmatales bacterium]
MDAMKPIEYDKISEINITKEMKSSFLSYAMSVIVSRALPDVRDGLKPVHRRILFGMEELGVQPDKAFKKSARIVGDVMGKYHPHGDSAIYDAMVRMAQEFSYRYPLVNGHGNFGSIDGDGAAAMRYTEAKMAKITAEMLEDIKKDTIDFVDNYDGSEKEPSVLPSKFPNLLVNGSTGIAVGMATNIPPHNLGEVIDGVLAMMDNPDVTVDELLEKIQGPDFPTGGILMGLSGLRAAYETGNGSVKIRAKADITEEKSGKKTITVTEIPYQVNKSRLIEKIAELAKEKRIEGITDLRDESNRKGIRIVIELRRDVNAEVTLNNLYKFTPLQVSFGMNMLALVNNQPKVLALRDILRHYIDHQVDVLTRRSKFDLDKAKSRAHVLEGLLIALDNIDEVIETIRSAYDDAEEKLMERFALSAEQTRAILEMRLRRLSGLEHEKITSELDETRKTIAYLESLLSSEASKYERIRDDLIILKEKYNDARRTEISLAVDLDIEDEDLIPEEHVMITITRSGYCKRMTTETYKAQNRGGKGLTGMKTHDDDAVEHIIHTSTHDFLLFFTNHGRVYKMKGYKIPAFGRQSRGLPLVNMLQLEKDENVQAVANIKDFDNDHYLFFVTRQGVVKRTAVRNYQNIRTSGIRAINLKEGDELLDVRLTQGEQDVVIGASNGKAIRFNETTVREMGRVASGVRGIRLEDPDAVVGISLVGDERNQVLIVTENGYGKRTHVDEYRQQNRGGKGVKTLNVTVKNGTLVTLKSVAGDEDLIILSNKGMMIRVPIEQIALSSRATQGVRLMRLNEGHKVVTVAVVPKEENGEDEEYSENGAPSSGEQDGLFVEEGGQTPEAAPAIIHDTAQGETMSEPLMAADSVASPVDTSKAEAPEAPREPETSLKPEHHDEKPTPTEDKKPDSHQPTKQEGGILSLFDDVEGSDQSEAPVKKEKVPIKDDDPQPRLNLFDDEE